MKIVYLRSNPVNPDPRVEKEVNSLIRAGHEVTVLGWDRLSQYRWNEDLLCLPDGKATIYRIGIPATFGGGMKNLTALFRFSKELYSWLAKNHSAFDCIHACDLDTGLVAMRIAKKYHMEYVYDIYDYYPAAHHFPKLLTKFVIYVEKKTIDNANCVILCTEQRKSQIKGTHPKKIEIIHNSPSKALLQKRSSDFTINTDSRKTRIGYVGILSRSRLLEEIASVVSQDNSLELHVGGFGQLESYFNMMSQKYENIKFYGKLSYANTLKLESDVDILTAIYDPAVPNHKYAAPNKFYEALMLGKPVIMIHGTGVDHLIDEYDIGATIDFTPQGFSAGVKQIISKKADWPKISSTENMLFEKQYSWDIMEDRLSRIYSTVGQKR